LDEWIRKGRRATLAAAVFVSVRPSAPLRPYACRVAPALNPRYSLARRDAQAPWNGGRVRFGSPIESPKIAKEKGCYLFEYVR
jgi:hypothetical protein